MSCISRPKHVQPLGWGSPCHRLHMNSLRYSCYLSDYRPSVGRPSTERWPITDRYIGEVSMNEKLYRPRHIWNDYRPCLDRVSSDYRPSLSRLSTNYRPLYRLSVDRLSTDYLPQYRPSVDRLSTECRPSVDRLSIAISTDRSVDTTKNFTLPFPLILDTTEWKYALLIDRIRTDRF